MLVLALFIILAAVALPSVQVTSAIIMRITTITFFIGVILCLNVLNYEEFINNFSLFNGIFVINNTTIGANVLLLFIGGVALTPWANYSVNGPTSHPVISTYSLFALFTIIGAYMLIICGDMITLYLSLELQSFSLYILASLYRDNESATHSGLLYFLLGALSSCFILLGSALIYNEFGVISIDTIMSLMQVNNFDLNNQNISVFFGWIAIATGFLFKVSGAPFHNWAPDVYDGVPTIVTTWLTNVPKISLLFVILMISLGIDNNILNITFDNNVYPLWSTILLISAVFSLIIGTVVGLSQIRIKRLLAYSTISHIGFMLLALAIHSENGVEAFLFYLLQYTLTSIVTFMIVLAMGYSRNVQNKTDIGFISEFTGIFQSQPILSISFAVCLFSIAGVPPLMGFFGKQFVLSAAINAGYVFISIIGIIVSVISCSYYLYIVRVIHFDQISANTQNIVDNINISTANSNSNSNTNGITNVHSYIISMFTLFISFFIINPQIILNSISLMAISLYST